MLNLRCFLACLQFLFICQMGLVSGYRQQRKLIEDIDWSYTESLNQTNWVKKYPTCNGAKQSPINIDEDLTQLNMNLQKLTFQGWEQVSNHILIRNTGKTVEINLTGDYYLSGGALDAAHKASRITFHWGKCNSTSDGSEHSLEGQKFPLEMQIFCFNDNQFESLDDAIKGNGKLKALSVLFKIGQENKKYDSIINGVDNVHRFGKKAELEPFVLLDLLPSNTDKYYTYNGSLSTPPCSETVEWIVFKDTVTISETQLEFFCEILTMQQSGYVMVMDYLQNNFRQQQYKFSGQVFSSYTGTEEIHETVCSSEPDDVQAESQNSTSLLITWKRPRVVYDAVIERYVVYYQPLQGQDQTKHEFLTDGYQDLGAILYNLVPNTSYVLQVVALCSNSLYGKRSDQVVLDLTTDGPGNDLFIDVTETEEEIEDSEEDIQEEKASNIEIPLSTISTKNQIQGQGAQATTSQYTEELGSQPYKATLETWKGQSHVQQDRLKNFLSPTLQSTSKTTDGITTDAYKDRVKTTEQDEEEQVYKNKELKSRVELWMLNISDTTKLSDEINAQTNAINEVPVTTTNWKRRILLPTTKPLRVLNDTSFTTTATFNATFIPEKTSQGDNISSQSPQPYSEDISSTSGIDKVFLSTTPDDKFDVLNATSQPTVSPQEKKPVISPVNATETTSTISSRIAEPAPSALLPELDRAYISSSTFSPLETFQSISPSFGQHGSASSANEVLSQTTQPISNGEIHLQPSYTSEVFPLVTSLLSGTQLLKATPAASDIGQILHATPVFPSVDVSFEPSLSAYDDVPLLTFSSTSSASKMFYHHAVSEMFSQVTQTVATDTLSLHVSLALPEINALDQPNQTHYTDVKPHQTAHAASEMLTFGDEGDTFNNVQLISQLETPSTDLKMHAHSAVSELTYALSNHLASTETFAVSSDSSAFVHDSVGIFHQGALITMLSTELYLKPSTVTIQDVLLQPTRSTLSDGDNSETFSGSGFFFDGIYDLKSHNESSASTVVEVKYTTPELNHSTPNATGGKIGDFDTGSQTTSPYGDVALHTEHEGMTDLSSSDVFRETQSSPEIHPVSLPTTRIFDADINAMSENLLPVQPLNAVSTTSGDILLKAMLAAASKTISAFTDMLLMPTQEFFYETPEKAINEAFTQTMSQLPNASAATAVPSVGGLNQTSTSHHIGSNTGSLLLPSSAGAIVESLLHSAYVSPVGSSLSPSSVQATNPQQTMSVLHENVVLPRLFTNVNSDAVVSHSYGNDITDHPLDIVPSFLSAISHRVSTAVLPVSTLAQQDSTLYHHTPPYAYPTHGNPVVSLQYTKGSVLPNSALSTEARESVHHPVILPNVYVFVTADSPNSESPSTLSMLTATSQTPTDVLPTFSSDTKTGPSVVDDGYLVVASTDSTSHTETQDNVVAVTSRYVQSVMENSNLSMSEPSEQSEEGSALSTSVLDSQTSPGMEERTQATPINTEPKKPSDTAVLETNILTDNIALEATSESSSWAVLTSDEESGSGQSASDSLSDNETSTDFNFSDLNDREKDSEVAVEPGKADLTPGSEMTSPPSVTSDRSTVVNVSEAEASNSSHESRVGLAEGLESQEKTIIPLVVVSSLTFICLVVLVGILIYWRKCFQTAHFYLEDNTSPRVISSPPVPVFPVSDNIGAIPLKQFPKHVAELHARNGFTEEFETLKEFYQEIQNCTVDLGITCDSSNNPENKNKNRYINIVAYDHSRVKLAQLGEKDGKATDYINANYVDGYNRPKAYIAAQGPLKSTAEDFWRMIWEHNVEVIVMITNLVEKGRRKCDQYWPTDGSEEYDTFLVTQKSTHVLAYYTVRIFTLQNTKMKKGSQKGRVNERVVTQYHYTQWPDMGVPEYSLPVLTFVRKASAAKCAANGPVVVHCSAGVGRTGTYIVLDSMLQQIQQEGTVNIFGFLKHIRTQRNYLVQTEEQYIFIHDALVEAILSRETEVQENHIHAYVNTLLTTGPSGKTRLETQFKLLSESNILQCDYSTALKAQNRDKNRTSSVIPVERSRVGLSSLVGEGTDYINASYIMGYHESNEFIITQHPLLHTIKDFWRMIWDHNSQIIVMLPDNQNMAEDEFVYWPNKDEPITCGNFTVSMVGEDHVCLSNEERLIIQDFILEATQDDYVLEVKHFHCPKWPNPDSRISKTFELINLIKEEAANKDGPIVVHDEYGGVTAGTFCALSTLMQQLEKENSVDVYQTTKMINLMRPGIFTDIEQYQFLYKAILSLVSTRQEACPVACMESNGSTLPDGNTSESLESLV